VAAVGTLGYLKLAYFSIPAHDRTLYRAIRRVRARGIVELGVGMGDRAQRLIRTAQRYAAGGSVRYTGVDLFEARSDDRPSTTLKRAHRMLGQTGAKVLLAPGDPLTALARVSNSVTGSDLLIISADQDPQSLTQAWFYVPRMLSEKAEVFIERRRAAGKSYFELIPQEEVWHLAEKSRPDGRRAA